jgi:hypothetical protein
LKPACERIVLNLHNVESELLRRSAEVESGPAALLFRRFAAQCAVLECKWVPEFDTVLSPSAFPNTIPYVERPSVAREHEIAFSGNLEYQPNQVAVRWFAREIWPILRAADPELGWRLIGKNEHAIRRYIGPGIVATGPVPAAIPELARAKVAVVPLLSGSGTRVKIIEAWAAGVPVISTTIGAEGLPYTAGEDILIADTGEEFAAADRGRVLYEQRLTWQTAWDELLQLGL